MKEVRIFSPASIANISCGFDVLGMCLDNVGDEMIIRKSEAKGIKITKITGQKLPLETHKNVAGVAAQALLEDFGKELGFEIEIHKKIKAGSGIGSSAASSAGAVAGINFLLGSPYSNKELIRFAMEGERLASGTAHADNVAPVLLGGFTLVRDSDSLDIIKLNTPLEIAATVIHPQIEVKTSDARALLKKKVPLKKAITQWGNLGALVSGLYEEDYELISRSLEDVIVEPLRSILIPEFDKLKKECKKAGALGSGISGSGPSVFALSKGIYTAHKVAEAMNTIYQKTGIQFDTHVSTLNYEGIKILESK
jgi:homoserine kinase